MARRHSRALAPVVRIDRAILLLRGHKVLLDSELAGLYGVATKRLNEQVRRNRERFPQDFVFQLTHQEHKFLRSQNATLVLPFLSICQDAGLTDSSRRP